MRSFGLGGLKIGILRTLTCMFVPAFALYAQPNSGTPLTSAPQVRPCTPEEFASKDFPKFTHLLKSSADDLNRMPLIRCEAVNLPWLPGAKILRFHSTVNVDYSLTYTFARAAESSKLWLIRSAEGIVQSPDANGSDGLGAMNDLLNAEGAAVDESQLGYFSNFYLFLLDRENFAFATFPSVRTHLSPLHDHQATINKDGTRLVVSLADAPWKLNYSVEQGKFHLDSVTDISISKPNECLLPAQVARTKSLHPSTHNRAAAPSLLDNRSALDPLP